MKRRYVVRVACLAMAVAMTTVAFAVHAQSPVIYPAKGQPAPLIDRDKYECHDWARAQSGFDPTQPTQAQATPAASQQAPSGPSLSTMARGAASGAAIAEITDHSASRGAAYGLVGASVVSRAREQQAMQARQQQARGQAQSAYQRGFAACMEARGYVVK